MAPTEFKDPRASTDVGRKLDSAKAALKKQESKQGASVEEITAELTRAKKAYDTARNEVKTMVALNKVRTAAPAGGSHDSSAVGTDDIIDLVLTRCSSSSLLLFVGARECDQRSPVQMARL